MEKTKKLLCMLLCCCMLLGTIVGCGSTSESESETDPVTLTEQTEVPAITEMKEPDAELKRAINAGMMPEAWCAQLDNPITFKQYTSVLTRIVELWNADKLSEWQNITSLAVNSDEPMRRQDGILMLSYLWILMGKGTDHVYGYLDENLHDDHVYSDDFMLSQTRDITWDYQYFPDWETDVYDIYRANYMWGGIMTFSSVMSPVSGEFVLSPNDSGSSA